MQLPCDLLIAANANGISRICDLAILRMFFVLTLDGWF